MVEVVEGPFHRIGPDVAGPFLGPEDLAPGILDGQDHPQVAEFARIIVHHHQVLEETPAPVQLVPGVEPRHGVAPDRKERLAGGLQGKVALFRGPVVVQHRPSDGGPAVGEHEVEDPVHGLVFLDPAGLQVVLHQAGLIILAVGHEFLEVPAQGHPGDIEGLDELEVPECPFLPIGRPKVLSLEHLPQGRHVRQGLGPELGDEIQVASEGPEVVLRDLVAPIPARVGVVAEIAGGVHEPAGILLGDGLPQDRVELLPVHRGLVVATPDRDRGVVVELPHHVLDLQAGVLREGVGPLVAPLQGEVLPHHDPGLVAGVVEFPPVDVGVDPYGVEVGPPDQVDVAAGLLRAVFRQVLGGDQVRSPGEELSAVQEKLPFGRHADVPEAEPRLFGPDLAARGHFPNLQFRVVEVGVALVPGGPETGFLEGVGQHGLGRALGQVQAQAGGLLGGGLEVPALEKGLQVILAGVPQVQQVEA